MERNVEPQCSACHFWTGNKMAVDQQKETGDCRRFPAMIGGIVPQQGVAGPTVAAVTFFPTLRGTQWCGEFKQQPAAIQLQ